MICNNCKQEVADNVTTCPHCAQEITAQTTQENVNNSQDEKKNKKKTMPKLSISKTNREKINIFGISLPIVFVSFFCIILGYGGYISTLFLLAIVFLLARVENKTLANNFLVVSGLYAAQFTIETATTFVMSLPIRFFNWLAEMGSQKIDFATTVGNISTGFSNVSAIISNITSLCFFVLYILCVLSLLKSDTIRIPFIAKLMNKYLPFSNEEQENKE